MLRKLTTTVAALAVATAAFGGIAAAQDNELTVGAIYLDAQGFYAGVRKGVQVGGTELGKNVQIIETNAGGDVGKEASFIDRLVSAGVQAIILSAVSPDGSVRAIKRANEAGIPIVCYNTCINEKDMKEYVYAYTVGDPFQFGYKIGQVAAEDFVKDGKTEPKIGILNCEFVDVCVQRRLGFEKALSEIPALREEFRKDVKILGTSEGVNQSLEKALRVDDFMELAELKVRDALHREESCGGHFREEHQTPEGEALRDDEHFAYVGAWEYAGPNIQKDAVLHKEPLVFESVPLSQRSYK